MGYYIRVLSPSERVPAVSSLQAALANDKVSGNLTTDGGTDEDWSELLLAHDDGREIAVIERNVVSSGSLGEEEIDEFRESIEDCKPASAARWLADYFHRVKTIYAFQVLSGTEIKNGWEILDTIKNALHAQVSGIFQADAEGFSDEEGYHILWQFSDSVKGPWWMGVLQSGKWIHFQMDLGNKTHRGAFFGGEVPRGVRMADEPKS